MAKRWLSRKEPFDEKQTKGWKFQRDKRGTRNVEGDDAFMLVLPQSSLECIIMVYVCFFETRTASFHSIFYLEQDTPMRM